MSVSSNKKQKNRRAEDLAGGRFPLISLDDAFAEVWVHWQYHVAPDELRLEIPLTDVSKYCPWLYVNENDHALDPHDPSSKEFELKFGAITRMKLMQTYASELRNEKTRMAGLARLHQAATAAGLYGKREPRR